MTVIDPGSFVGDLEERAATRFVRWDRALWRSVLHGPAARLAERLDAAGTAPVAAEALLGSYLRLACEGIGLGYLVPPRGDAGQTGSAFTHLWTHAIPGLLAEVPVERRGERLAACWNLGENLERAPSWLQRILLGRLGELSSLDALEALIAGVGHDVLQAPSVPLTTRARASWLRLPGDDQRFLPGRMAYVAPRVLCVIDRHRDGSDGRPPVTQGVWLTDPPVALGPVPVPEARAESTDCPWPEIRRDPRFTGIHLAVRNPWSAAVTLRTSQMLVVVSPL